jgi:hypothetical protein
MWGRQALAGLVLATLSLAVAGSSALAGKTRFGWITDTETLPQRAVELESWVLEQDGKGEPPSDQTLVWWAPVIGLTDRLELALPVEIAFTRAGTTSSTQLLRFGAEVRWRLVDPDLVEAGPFAALIRFAAKRPVTARATGRFEAELVFSYDVGPVHIGADGTAVFDVNSEDSNATTIFVRPGAGVSVRAVGEFSVGAEIFAEIFARGQGTTWVAAGPNVAFSHGRSWLSGAFLIGIEHIDIAPRLIWAIAF